MKLVGITGQANSGKSALANIIAKEKHYCIISLADKFKRFLYNECGFTKEQLWGESENRNTPHKFLKMNNGNDLLVRYFLNMIGSEMGRDMINKNIWTTLTLKDIEENNKKFWLDYSPENGWKLNAFNRKKRNGFIIPDIRYNNELLAIKEKGALIIRITRPN